MITNKINNTKINAQLFPNISSTPLPFGFYITYTELITTTAAATNDY